MNSCIRILKFQGWPVLAAIILLSSCRPDGGIDPAAVNTVKSHPGDVATEWYRLILKLTAETPGFTPPVAARALGYTGVGLYEVLQPGMPDYRSVAGYITDLEPGYAEGIQIPDEIHWGLVANKALANLAKNFYGEAHPPNIARIEQLEQSIFNRESVGLSNNEISISLNYAMEMSSRLLAYAQSDGQTKAYNHNFPEEYNWPVFPGSWIPTPPLYLGAMQPYWGHVRPFIEAGIHWSQPPQHPEYSTDPASEFYLQAAEVYTAVINITPEQSIIAWFWSDDPGKSATPPGHSISILTQILEQESADLAFSSYAYLLLGIAMHDAFISCWKSKYTYNLVRPVTYIRQHIDPDFVPVLTTPPFPEYTSGHSVQAGAASVVLTHLFGAGYSFTDRTQVHRTDITGTPRNFNSFNHMAEEAAISRLYGGIHFRAAIENGTEQGKIIGELVKSLPIR